MYYSQARKQGRNIITHSGEIPVQALFIYFVERKSLKFNEDKTFSVLSEKTSDPGN